MMCGRSRFGWRTQRALRSGRDPRVIKIRRSPKLSTMWVTHPSPEGPTFLLTRMANGSIWLLNAAAEDTPRVKLALSTKRSIYPLISADGRLQLMEALGDPESDNLCNLCWHTIDTSTGESLASEQKLKWHPAFCKEDSPYQAITQRILAMVDSLTIAVLDACSLQETVQLSVTLQGSQLARTACRMSSLSWAPVRPWVAVLLQGQGSSALQGICSEVHIYDTASGECLQYVTLSAEARLSWSPSLALAAVFGERELLDPSRYSNQKIFTTEHAAAYDRLADLETIRILDPARDAVMEVPGEEATWGWTSCKWSPVGALLIAESSLGDLHCSIVDGSTGQVVMRSDLSWIHASWAAEAEVAYLPMPLDNGSMCIRFEHIHDTWHQQKMHFSTELDGLRGACISPDGGIIAGWMYDESVQTKGMFHHNLATGQGHVCVHHWSPSARGAYFASNFAPLPRAWLQVTASTQVSTRCSKNLCSGRTERQRSLILVEGQAHAVRGSWTMADLLEQSPEAACLTANPCDIMEDCVWAPNGRHLAVFCNTSTWALVVTFQEPV